MISVASVTFRLSRHLVVQRPQCCKSVVVCLSSLSRQFTDISGIAGGLELDRQRSQVHLSMQTLFLPRS